MSITSSWRPRLNVDITPEQDAALKKHLKHGVKGELFRCIIDDLIAMLNENPTFIIGMVMSRKASIVDILPGWKEEK